MDAKKDLYLVVSSDAATGRTSLLACTPERRLALHAYDVAGRRVAESNSAAREAGQPRDIVELLQLDAEDGVGFFCEAGATMLRGIDSPGSRALLNNARDEDEHDQSTTGGKSRSALYVPVRMSPQLCAFLRRPAGTVMSAAEVTRAVNDYVRVRGLHGSNGSDKKKVRPDAALRALLLPGQTDIAELDTFDLHRAHIQPHMERPWL